MRRRGPAIDHQFQILADVFASGTVRRASEPLQKPLQRARVTFDGVGLVKANPQLTLDQIDKLNSRHLPRNH